MKHLITGGAGFVGSHLAGTLLERGDDVYVIDNLSTGSIENIEHLKDHPSFHYTIDTISNEPVTAELVDRVDVIFHLAAAVGVRLIVESPELGAKIADFMRKTMAPENAWQLHLDDQNRLRWESEDGTLGTQPDQNFLRRFKSGIFGLFPLEEHL